MEIAANNSSLANHYTFACRRHKILCQQLYGPALGHAVLNIVVSAVSGLTAILGNSLVFAAFYHSESLRGKPANMILLSLAATDFLSGAIAQPFFIWGTVLMIGGCTKTICTAFTLTRFSMVFLIGATAINLSVTTLDRYIAICHSFRYLELVTESRVHKLLVSLWLAWIVVSFLGLRFVFPAPAMLVIVLSSNILSITLLYFKIYREIRRISANPVTEANESEPVERKTRERKSVKTLAIILGLLLFCFVPMILHWICTRLKVLRGLLRRELFLIYASNAVLSNSSLNVFIYYWRNEEMRAAMRKVIRKITARCRNEVNP